MLFHFKRYTGMIRLAWNTLHILSYHMSAHIVLNLQRCHSAHSARSVAITQ